MSDDDTEDDPIGDALLLALAKRLVVSGVELTDPAALDLFADIIATGPGEVDRRGAEISPTPPRSQSEFPESLCRHVPRRTPEKRPQGVLRMTEQQPIETETTTVERPAQPTEVETTTTERPAQPPVETTQVERTTETRPA